MTRRSKDRKGRGGGGSSSRGGEEGDGGGVKGSSSQSLSGSHSSLGRAGEDSLMAGEDLLMVRRYRTRGRSLGAGTGNRVNKNINMIFFSILEGGLFFWSVGGGSGGGSCL